MSCHVGGYATLREHRVDTILTRRVSLTVGLLLLAASLVCAQGSKLPLVGVGGAAAGGQTAPTRISYNESTDGWNSNTSPKSSASITWQTGDVIIVIVGQESAGRTIGNPTATGLTFSNLRSNTLANTCTTSMASAVAGSNGSGAVSVTSDGVDFWSFAVWVYRGTNGVGNTAKQQTTTHSVSVTPLAGAHSAFVWGVFDFNTGAVGTITPTPTNTGEATQFSPNYTVYIADLADQASAGAVSYGLTGSGGGPFSIMVAEIKGQ